jgi:glycosyltransferase involved in cell wall biosynthesis/cbb3-type cytochrome oxidase subunit 3
MTPSVPIPSVSAIVPARNEQASIGACVESLATQREIGEILVVDDQSTDNTAEVVRQETLKWPQVRLLQSQGLPAGWVGKNYAVWLGAQDAKSKWLLFTDADAVHSENAAATALTIAAKNDAVMVSFSPEQVMETWYEKSLIPYIYCRLARKYSFDDVNEPGSEAAAANGQFVMIQRDAYEAVGGHASVASEVLEDVALAKRVKQAGYRIWFTGGKGIVGVRMYRSFGAMWEGWAKNLYPLMGGTPRAADNEILRALLPVGASFAAGILGWAITTSCLAGLAVLVVFLVGMTISYYRELRRNQFEGSLARYGIFGRTLFAGVLWVSYRSHKKGTLKWKGREYPVGTPNASN